MKCHGKFFFYEEFCVRGNNKRSQGFLWKKNQKKDRRGRPYTTALGFRQLPSRIHSSLVLWLIWMSLWNSVPMSPDLFCWCAFLRGGEVKSNMTPQAQLCDSIQLACLHAAFNPWPFIWRPLLVLQPTALQLMVPFWNQHHEESAENTRGTTASE